MRRTARRANAHTDSPVRETQRLQRCYAYVRGAGEGGVASAFVRKGDDRSGSSARVGHKRVAVGKRFLGWTPASAGVQMGRGEGDSHDRF